MKPEEIRSAIDNLSIEQMKDVLSIVLAEAKPSSQVIAGKDNPELVNFAQAIIFLKQNYDFEELDYFNTEADLVYVNTGDRRILLTDREKKEQSESTYKEKPTSDKANPMTNDGRFSQLEI